MTDASMAGRVCVVTGTSSGIGTVMSEALAQRGAHVVMVARNPETGERARAKVAAAAPSAAVELELADLSEMSQVRALAERLARLPKIDVLMNNAGIYLPKRHLTSEGFETMIAVNHLAPFLLTQLLRRQLAASGSARVVTTSSIGHNFCRFDLDDLQGERSFSPINQYNVSKLSNILFTKEAARRYAADGARFNCCHPGAVGTGFGQDESSWFSGVVKLAKPFMRSPERGARTGVYLATSPSVAEVTGEYFVDERPKAPRKIGRDPALAARLWEKSAELTGVAA